MQGCSSDEKETAVFPQFVYVNGIVSLLPTVAIHDIDIPKDAMDLTIFSARSNVMNFICYLLKIQMLQI